MILLPFNVNIKLPSQICDFTDLLDLILIGTESIASKAFGQGLNE